MKTRNKTITIALCIIAMMIFTPIRAQVITLDSNRTIDVLEDFLNIKEKLITYKDTDLWINYSKKWEIVNITMYDENMDEKDFVIYYKGIIGKKDLLYPSRQYCKKIKKNYHFTIIMNEKWIFTVNDNASGGFYMGDKNGSLIIKYIQAREMTYEEMQFFGKKLYQILQIVNK